MFPLRFAAPVVAPSFSTPAPRRRVPALVLLCAVTFSAVSACPTPRPSPTAPVSVGSWVDTARTVLSTIAWAVPAARTIVALVVPDAVRPIVDRALGLLSDAAQRLADALDAYSARGGDQCAAHAAVGGLHGALVGLARSLADSGLALGNTFERVADSVGSIADALVPRCTVDAGWSSTGDTINAELSGIAREASSRGLILRRDLDNLRPAGQ